MEPKNTEAQQKRKDDAATRTRTISNQWREFSKTLAWQDFEEFCRSNDEMLITYAKERVMPSPVGKGEEIIIDSEMANSLLQNARGADIVKSYIDGYVNLDVEQLKITI